MYVLPFEISDRKYDSNSMDLVEITMNNFFW